MEPAEEPGSSLASMPSFSLKMAWETTAREQVPSRGQPSTGESAKLQSREVLGVSGQRADASDQRGKSPWVATNVRITTDTRALVAISRPEPSVTADRHARSLGASGALRDEP